MGKLCDIYMSSFYKTLLFNFLNLGYVYVSLFGYRKTLSGEYSLNRLFQNCFVLFWLGCLSQVRKQVVGCLIQEDFGGMCKTPSVSSSRYLFIHVFLRQWPISIAATISYEKLSFIVNLGRTLNIGVYMLATED